jgi:hypothetical protein
MQNAVFRSALVVAVAISAGTACSGSDARAADPCKPDDADGIIGGQASFVVSVTDDAFGPRILTAQNQTDVTLKLTNDGTTPHGLAVACLPTPNDDGCPSTSCFPDAATVAPLDPGADATVTFRVPLVEGIYAVTTGVDGDAPTGQFIVQ